MNQLVVHAYAKLIYSLVLFILRLTYRGSNTKKFSVDRHDRMVKLNRLAEKIFNFLVCPISKGEKYNHTIAVDYEGSMLLIRPFIFSEIIMVSGRWEPYVRSILDKEIEKNDVVVDVGASIGIYAISLAKKVKKVIAFEPHPKTSQILEKNVKLNQLDNIVLIKRVAGESKQKVIYGLSRDPYESGVLDTTHLASGKINSRIDMVETESIDLDTALANENKIDWLLIDAEGFEANVLNGAKNILTKYAPKIIFESYSENIDMVKKILVNNSYSVTQIYTIYYYAVKNRVTDS